ncbi:type II toxin-antitoxin system VapC family toxin [Paenibacillus medicaginis]|uniref:Ribonuclease VapC n=1 Tax=Paenibacillus medicaginis TaxID=1470560 RepID=A0ABV5C9G2_9BACL
MSIPMKNSNPSKKHLVDSNIVIGALGSDLNCRAFFANDLDMVFSVIVIAEVLNGAENAGVIRTIERIMTTAEIIPLTAELSFYAGKFLNEQRLLGRPCKTNDGVLVATCIQHDLILVSKDKRLLKFADYVGVETVDLN